MVGWLKGLGNGMDVEEIGRSQASLAYLVYIGPQRFLNSFDVYENARWSPVQGNEAGCLKTCPSVKLL